MNPYNLIDPYSPQEQMSWHRWRKGSLIFIIIVVTLLFGTTIKLIYDIFVVKKRLAVFRSSGALEAINQYKSLSAQSASLKQQIKLISSWQQSSFFYKHISMISEKIPAQVMLEMLECNEEGITMEGIAYSIETLLGFIHDLNTTELFQGMNLIELKPSSMINDEKKLVNFLIKGKLRGL